MDFKMSQVFWGQFLTQMMAQPMLQVTETENKYWEHGDFVVSEQQLSGQLSHILRFPPVLISDPFLCDTVSVCLVNKTSLCSFSIRYPNGNFWGQFYVESYAQLLPSLINVQNQIH